MTDLTFTKQNGELVTAEYVSRRAMYERNRPTIGADAEFVERVTSDSRFMESLNGLLASFAIKSIHYEALKRQYGDCVPKNFIWKKS